MSPILLEVLPNFAGPSPDEPLRQAHPGDAGMDLYATTDVVIPPGERALVPVGLKFALPILGIDNDDESGIMRFAMEAGLQLEVRPKSGLALKLGLTLLNTPGTVDSGYRGEVAVILYNANHEVTASVLDTLVDVLTQTKQVQALESAIRTAPSSSTITIKRGQKIAQAVFTQYIIPEIQVLPTGVNVPDSVRGVGGFGSTGVH